MKKFAVLAAAATMAVSAPAMAQFFEGFEHGDWLGNYAVISGSATPINLVADAARTGALGAQFQASGWWKNTNAGATISDGQSYEYYFRSAGAGRAYIGFTSDDAATEAYTVVAAPNTGNVIIQRNNGFGFADLASTPITWSTTDFYRVAASYSGGIISVEVFDAGGASLGSAMADTGYSGGGTLFYRGFSNVQVDDVTIVPAPASLALLGLGGLAATRRRR
ncbi:MAG: PEP-CTERM sorting domain-containing protein [Phycisphaerales bacterium JB039]